MKLFFSEKQKINAQKSSINSVDNMDGHAFEYFCADMLKKLGYTNIRVTKASGDNGVDILAVNNGVPYAIQCKRYAKKVGNRAVQEVFSGASYYNCKRAIVITNNYFTDQAIDTARNLGVTLWDRNFLAKMMRASYSDSEKAKKAIANSNYQAKSRKKNQSQPSGCLWLIAIVIVFLFICMIVNSASEKKGQEITTTSTQVNTTTTQSNNGGAIAGFDSINSLNAGYLPYQALLN